jgi:hypothetical protein
MMRFSKLFRASFAVVATFGLAATSSTVFGQASAPSATSREMRTIRQQDVGDGYTSQSLNAISMQNARAQVGVPFNATRPSSLGGSRVATGGGGGAKPFSQVGSSPTVSPYLNLFREDFDGGGDFNYQTLVRPQFQQLATNQQFQRQNNELAQRVQTYAARSDYSNPAGSEQQYPTGHSTAFGYYGSFYPGMARRGR